MFAAASPLLVEVEGAVAVSEVEAVLTVVVVAPTAAAGIRQFVLLTARAVE